MVLGAFRLNESDQETGKLELGIVKASRSVRVRSRTLVWSTTQTRTEKHLRKVDLRGKLWSTLHALVHL